MENELRWDGKWIPSHRSRANQILGKLESDLYPHLIYFIPHVISNPLLEPILPWIPCKQTALKGKLLQVN